MSSLPSRISGALTDCVSTAEVLGLKLESPE